jgi:acid phosphatase (class A)
LLFVALLTNGAQAREPNFVTAEQVRAFQILPAPPANEAAETKKELAKLHQLESARTPMQIQAAVADDKDESIFLFRNAMGASFTAVALPLTAAFSERVKSDAGSIAAPAKKGFLRVHPYNLDKTLKPICETKIKDDSYPSGHTFAGYLLALALIDMVPEKRDAILARADDYGHNRMICGVQYESDLQASKLLAYSTFALMANHPQYKKEMMAARAELRQAFGLSVASN